MIMGQTNYESSDFCPNSEKKNGRHSAILDHINLKFCTRIHSMIVYKFPIHYVYKLHSVIVYKFPIHYLYKL